MSSSFEYVNELTDKIVLDYNPTNDSNRVVTDKRIGNTDELLDGVTLRIERKVDNGWETIDEWMTVSRPLYEGPTGGDYRLVEIKAAEGFKLLAEPLNLPSVTVDGSPALLLCVITQPLWT